MKTIFAIRYYFDKSINIFLQMNEKKLLVGIFLLSFNIRFFVGLG